MTAEERLRLIDQAVGASEGDGALGWLRCLIAEYERLRNGVDREIEVASADLEEAGTPGSPFAHLVDVDPSATSDMLRECRELANSLERLAPGLPAEADLDWQPDDVVALADEIPF